MKQLLFACLLLPALFGMIPIARAQESSKPKDPKEKIKSLEILFIAKQLDLSQAEAKNFWPVYDQYTKEVDNLIAENKLAQEEAAKSNDNSDPMQNQRLEKQFEFERRMVEIKVKYKNEFMKVLPARKVNTFYKAERDFKDLIYRQLRQRREQRAMQMLRQSPPPGPGGNRR
ncbi:hypothetical protein LX64_03011 [Chitinophaga skermanii]|uniref:LTXXQ motif family protein n=1 Tax=Chitinophaga skermanii TaxID=331697 RepID=A0A327QLB3_9BACT|nr:hypothetical protein [Chitinophaga skermanii]RAJ04133.1 hypothetical protein LX64_03011 [Chitinophaga skermanii]